MSWRVIACESDADNAVRFVLENNPEMDSRCSFRFRLERTDPHHEHGDSKCYFDPLNGELEAIEELTHRIRAATAQRARELNPKESE